MTTNEFEMFRDYIHEKCGILFADNKVYLLKNRLHKRMEELQISDYKDYFFYVKYDKSMKEFNKLMVQITTNETSFYRNEPQLLSFSEELIPKLVNKKEKNNEPKNFRIWSAGCSTGEEPYTLGILLLEALAGRPDWTIEIIANDISEQVLHTARAGEYKGNTLRNMKPEILKKYFVEKGEFWKVKPELKSLIKFSLMNLNEPRRLAMNGKFDVVFCRNVMIYFSSEVKKQIVRGFFNALNPGGYFYIGHSETMHGVSKAFKLVYFKNALVYYKEPISATAKVETTSTKELHEHTPSAITNSNKDGAKRAMALLSKIKPMTVKN